MFVGRLTKDPEIVNFDDGRRVVNVSIAVARPFKNAKGEIDTDFFTIAFWDYLVDYVIGTVKTGNFVGIKGRIQTTPNELANGYVLKTPTLIGERLMIFPQSGKSFSAEKNED